MSIDTKLIPRCKLCMEPVHNGKHSFITPLVVTCDKSMEYADVMNPTNERMERAQSENNA